MTSFYFEICILSCFSSWSEVWCRRALGRMAMVAVLQVKVPKQHQHRQLVAGRRNPDEIHLISGGFCHSWKLNQGYPFRVNPQFNNTVTQCPEPRYVQLFFSFFLIKAVAMSPQIKPWVLQFMSCCCFNIFQPWCWPQGPRTRHGVHHLRQFEGWWEERQSKRKRQRRWTKSWESWCLVWQWLTALEILEFEMNWCNCAHVSNHFQAIFFELFSLGFYLCGLRAMGYSGLFLVNWPCPNDALFLLSMPGVLQDAAPAATGSGWSWKRRRGMDGNGLEYIVIFGNVSE